jgi:Bacterial PH domain
MTAIVLEPPSSRAILVLFTLVVIIPMIITGAALVITDQSLSLNARLLFWITILSVATFLVLAGMTFRRQISVNSEEVRIVSSFYSLILPSSEIRADAIQVVNCKTDKKYSPRIRTNGLAIPGYQSGWFLTADNIKAFVVRSSNSCISIPTNKGYQILLGAQDAERAAQLFRMYLTEKASASAA